MAPPPRNLFPPLCLEHQDGIPIWDYPPGNCPISPTTQGIFESMTHCFVQVEFSENTVWQRLPLSTPPKTNIDTQNDGLEKVTPFKNGNFLVSIRNSLDFWGVDVLKLHQFLASQDLQAANMFLEFKGPFPYYPLNFRGHGIAYQQCFFSGQFITTFPAGWSPQMVVKSKGSVPQNGLKLG